MTTPPVRTLPVPLRTALPVWAPVLIGGAGAVIAAASGGLQGARLLLALVGVAALAVAGLALLRPPALVLDGAGLALRTPLGERWRHPWGDCGEFRVWRGDVVVWTNAAEAARRPRRAATWQHRAKADTGLVAQFGGLSATDLAALLNGYRVAHPGA